MAPSVEEEDYSEWVQEVIELIESGVLDSYLRPVIRAGFGRMAPERVVPDPTPTTIIPTQAPTIYTPSGPSRDDVFTGTVPPTSVVGPGTFEVNGKRYLKADVVGLIYKPTTRDLPDVRGVIWSGVTFRIVEINTVFALVEMVSSPHKMSKNFRRAFYSRIPIKLHKNLLYPILEV